MTPPGRPRRWAAIAALAVAVPAAPAAGHPHGWIDVQSTVVFDGAGRITALSLDWLFDDIYSVFILDGLPADGEARGAALREIARQDLENLREYGYFTDLRVDGARVETGMVDEFDTGLRDERLWLRFTVPLQTPVDPRADAVTFAVYDPTYFLEVLHVEETPVILAGAGTAGCSARVRQPAPTLEAIGLAASLDRSESAGDTLGEVFAQWVTITCE
ncbi:MAG: DUF1007 family protein [Rhodospirillaceae bacterium]|nr:DUF1007 family protein [Rhodospirillaceae bacterium]